MYKPFSQACERNKNPILNYIKQIFSSGTILEIGSGTGQHAAYFSEYLPNVIWQPSDVIENHDAIRSWTQDCKNVMPPLEINVAHSEHCPDLKFAGLYTANTCHIMSWKEVTLMFALAGQVIDSGSFCIYGPFKYNGQFTSISNEQFDRSLHQRDSLMGIRNIEEIEEVAQRHSFILQQDYEMPANNRLLHLRKEKI